MGKYIFLLIVSLIVVSCEKGEIAQVKEIQEINDKIEVKNGILSFSSKDLLGKTIRNLKKADKVDKKTRLKVFYDKGFMPLYPHFDENDGDRFLKFIEKKRNKTKKLMSLNLQAKSLSNKINERGELLEEIDDDLISDDEFASFLNDKREIIVNDTLYRFTYSGMFSVNEINKQELDNYISENNIEYSIPNPNTLTRGETEVTSQIRRYLPTRQEMLHPNECSISEPGVQQFFSSEDCYSSGGGGGGGTNGSSNTSTVDHTQGLVDLVRDLDACDAMTGNLHLWGLFGTTKKCYSNFDSKHRTKTKYWKENYLIWKSIGVKVKHQKKGWFWWYAKKTDEVALSVSQASFKFKLNVPNFPQSYFAPKFYFFENKVFNSQAQIINYYNQTQKPPFPEVPFISEVVVVEFVRNNFGSITVEKMRELFYNGIWSGAKSIVQKFKNRQPKNITHIIYTPTEVFMNYVDLENRKLNSKKIVNVFDYNFAIGVKFNVYIDANGHYSTNLGNFLNNPLGFIKIPDLYDYKDVKMDFVGATRRGNTWKGSRIVYSD